MMRKRYCPRGHDKYVSLLPAMLTDGVRFLWYNLRHYALALWGLRLRFDPNYPMVTRFFSPTISDSVFEYRTYALHALWAVVLVRFLPVWILWPLILVWALESFHRSGYLKSNLDFWRQVARESPKMRGQTRYMEQLLRWAEDQIKRGESWDRIQPVLDEASRQMDQICESGKR